MKNKFVESTIILMLGTMFTRLLGFFIKIYFTRIIGEGINLYSLLMPTYSLVIAITQLGLPYAISIYVARKKVRSVTVAFNIIPIALLFNLLVIFLLISSSDFIAFNLLHNIDLKYPIIAISFVIPFTTISGIIKGYFFGKQNMLPNAISSIFEQLIRMFIVFFILPIMVKNNILKALTFFMFSNAICELVQIIVYLFFLPKNIYINLKKLSFSKTVIKDVFGISIPQVSSRIIGNISYFLEPIILTNTLLFVGYNYNYIVSEYAAYNAYVLPTLLIPSFITQTLNTTLIPEISKNYKDKYTVRKIFLRVLGLSFIIGISISWIIHFMPSFVLNLIYHTSKGTNYLYYLSIIFPLFYLEGTLSCTLQALGNSKYTMKVTFITCIIKLFNMFLLSLLKIGIWSLIISEVIDIILVDLALFIKIKRKLYN